MNEFWDAVVIGAGPAGAVASWALASRGWRVLLVDKAAFPREKVCGCCLSARAIQSLKSAGLCDLVERLPKSKLKEFYFRMPGKKLSFSLPGGIALSRRSLDAALVEEARKAGVWFQPETKGKLGEIQKNFREVLLTSKNAAHSVMAKIVLICDGLGGDALNGLAGESKIAKGSRFGLNAVIEDGGEDYRDHTIYMACSPKGYAGLVRLEDGRLNVAAALDFPKKRNAVNPGAGISEILEAANFRVPPRLKEAEWHGTPSLTRSLKNAAGERYFVLGDSAGYSEPFTGEGMAWAIDSAVSLIRLLHPRSEDWNIRYAQAWEAWHRRHIKNRQYFSRLLSRGLRCQALLRPVVSLLQWKPQLAQSFVQSLCGG